VTVRADLHWPLSSPDGLVTGPESPFRNFYTELWEATFATMRHEGVDVALTGLDGDRLFGGNVFPYPDLLLTGHWPRLVRQLRGHTRSVTTTTWRVVRQHLAGPMLRAYYPPFRDRTGHVPWRRIEPEAPEPESKRVWWGLPSRYLRYQTLNHPFFRQVAGAANSHAASHGIEFRHPLLDHRLIEFAVRLPQRVVTEGFTQKALVRRAFTDILPNQVTELFDKIRPTTIGYRGLREREQHKIRPLMIDMRLSDLGLVDEAKLRAEYELFLKGGGESMFWYTICLEDWLRRYW
jgi:asparagine synthase (glutamine-hydrolysing)